MIKNILNRSVRSPLRREGKSPNNLFNRLFFVFLFLSSTLSFAQNNQRKFEYFTQTPIGFEIKTNDGKYIVKTYNENIFEISFIPKGEAFQNNSHAVILKPISVKNAVLKTDKTIEYKTNGIKITIQKSPFQISYNYKNKLLFSEKNGYIKTDSTEILDFNITSNEILYGGGARVLGMNRRGNRLQLYNRAHYGYETHSELMNYTMPLVLSSKIYAIHFDNAPIGFLDLDSKKNNTLSYETINGRKTYQIIAGNTWKSLINHYTDLTGKQPLPPRWILGNFASRMGYHTEKETREVVQKFRDEQIPLDAIIIDLYWFGAELKGTMGNLEFLKDSFPTPKKMIADFKKKHVKTILVTEPFILTTSKKWQEVSEQNLLGKDSLGHPFTFDFYFGHTGLIDIFNPKAKDWFWNIYKKYNHMGISGWWGDLGEPEVHPTNLIHTTGTADEVHNIYGHEWAKMLSEGFQKDFPEQRPFILMRAGYSGSQRFGMIPWSGDVNRSWGGLQAQPEIALQMGMQGMAYMHSDLGGFAGGDIFDPELYTRWLQYGVFQPVYRPHAQEHIAPEPVFHDDNTKAMAKKAIELRYQLLPYNYTLAFENNQTGIPLMRPLFFEEFDNIALQNSSKSYLWGNEFLISPVLKKGIKKQEIYFPKTNNWYDFYTDKKYEQGSTNNVNVFDDHIPTYVRAGAFVPMVKTIQNTEQYNLKAIDLHFYFDKDITESLGKIFYDDGHTPKAYEKGKYEILKFKSTLKDQVLSIEINSEIGKLFQPSDKEITLIIHAIPVQPKRVKSHKYQWNETKKILKLLIHYSNKKQIIKIKL